MMKKYICGILAGLILTAVSCKHNNLEELDAIKNQDRSVSGAGAITGAITKDNETVKVPFKITLSGPASKAFQVGITLNSDTVSKLIAAGTLTNTVLVPNGAIDYPSVVNVAFGADTASGVATIRLSVLEANYGKNIAFAFKLAAPGKGNQIKGSQSNIMVVLNTKDLVKEDEIHYVSILNGGGIMNVEYKKNYNTNNPAGATIPITINLAGVAGSAFNVKVKLNTDTIATLVQNKVLPENTISLKPTEFSIDTLVRVNSNSNTAVIRLLIEWPVFDANIIANKRFAFAISLESPTKHILHPVNNKLIVLVQPTVNLDNNSFITGKGTGLKAEYFTENQQLDFDGRKATLIRIDDNVDFGSNDNPDGWPGSPLISKNNFSSRWTGEFLAPVRGEYTFYENQFDDGARLFIDGKAIINDFTDGTNPNGRTGKIVLERGKRYKIEVNHRENGGDQVARLQYEVSSDGFSLSKRTVPRSQLFPAP
jgi:hypothetical protein